MSLHLSYRRRHFKRLLSFFVLLAALGILFWMSLISGSQGVVWSDSIKLFTLSGEDATFGIIVESIRLPRALAAMMVGAVLGLSGAVMQGVLRNPLASPFTLGVSQAAGFGAAIAIILFPSFGITDPIIAKFSIALFAFGASMLCILAIIWISSQVGMSPTSIILAGVALGSLFHSGTMFLQYFTDEMNAAATLFWTFGDLSKAGDETLFFLIAVFIPSLLYEGD